MVTFLLQAGGMHFDFRTNVGYVHALGEASKNKISSELTGFEYWALDIRLGYRWMFQNKWFLDWDFLNYFVMPTLYFKFGKVCFDDKMAIYGIVNPAGFMVHNLQGMLEGGKGALIGLAAPTLGAGMAYHVSKGVSLTAEYHLQLGFVSAMPAIQKGENGSEYVKKFGEALKMDSKKMDSKVLRHRLSIGVKLHSKKYNQA